MLARTYAEHRRVLKSSKELERQTQNSKRIDFLCSQTQIYKSIGFVSRQQPWLFHRKPPPHTNTHTHTQNAQTHRHRHTHTQVHECMLARKYAEHQRMHTRRTRMEPWILPATLADAPVFPPCGCEGNALYTYPPVADRSLAPSRSDDTVGVTGTRWARHAQDAK